MNTTIWNRHANLIGVVILTALVLFAGWFESARPGGMNFSSLTNGIVPFATLVHIGILTIVVVGLNLLMGYAGQISLGQAAFYGIGAYVSAAFTARASQLGVPAGLVGTWWWPWLLMVVAMLLTGAFAYLVGRPILRLKGHYLAMATLGLGIMVFIIFRETFGFDGIFGIPRLRIGSFEIWPIERYYYLVWGVALTTIVLSLNLVSSRVGRAFRAIHSGETAAETLGIHTAQFKVTALVVSAMYASVAGSLYAHFQAAVSPSPFGFIGSLELVIMAAVGGMASIWGAPFGVAVLLVLRELLRARMHVIVEGASGEYEIIAFGVLLILIMIFLPDGVIVGAKRAVERWRARQAISKRESRAQTP